MLVDAFPGSEQKSRCREYLKQYTESGDSETSKVMVGSTDSEMNTFVATLNDFTIYEGGHGRGRGRAHRKSSPCPPVPSYLNPMGQWCV